MSEPFTTKQFPKVVKATFPTYRRKTVMVSTGLTVSFYNLRWDGGSKNEYRFCRVDGGEPSEIAMNEWRQMLRENGSMIIPHGHAVVQGGTFCGKPGLLYIHIRPQDREDLK